MGIQFVGSKGSVLNPKHTSACQPKFHGLPLATVPVTMSKKSRLTRGHGMSCCPMHTCASRIHSLRVGVRSRPVAS